MKDRQTEHQYEPDSDSLSFPDDTVVGIVDDPDAASSAVEELASTGIPEDRISVLCCDAGAGRLDPSGERHGRLGRLQRLIQNFGDQDRPHVQRQAEELRAGNFLIAAPATDEEVELVAGILRAHGGRFINHYGSWSVTRIED